MNMKKNVLIILVTVMCSVLIGCATTQQPDLTGKWINLDHRWGLEFRDGKVFEWEQGEIRKEGTFALSRIDNTLLLVIMEDGKEQASFRLEQHTKNRLLITMGKEQVELNKQSTDPTKLTATE